MRGVNACCGEVAFQSHPPAALVRPVGAGGQGERWGGGGAGPMEACRIGIMPTSLCQMAV